METELAEHVREVLGRAGVADPAREARDIARAVVSTHGADPAAARRAAIQMADERASGRPLGYVTGRARFMGLDLRVAPGALVPREETEILARAAVDALAGLSGPARVVDMCAGSGNLACAIASHVQSAVVFASDVTLGSVAVARENVHALGLADRVTVCCGDLFAPLADRGLEGTIDLVVCNPPYISTGRLSKDRAALLEHEPREAFDGGPYGLTIHQRVIKEALPFLRPGGLLMFEIGVGQERQVKHLIDRSKSYGDVDTRMDAASEPRVVIARRKEP
jgi:release factor glutamine methyltransferase